jgi:DNA-binding NarL/FixJ family response regulator
MIDVVIADDHEIVRNGLSMVVDMQENMNVVQQASSYAELIRILSEIEADILILDLNLGDLNGLNTLENVAAAYPGLQVLVLSACSEENYALRAFKSGASGYLNKAVSSSEVINAIEKIIKGEKYISDTFADSLAYGTDLEKERLTLDELLSKREFEVLSLIALEKTPKEIAEILNLSPKTVSTYKTRIMDKLNIATSAQLFQFAYEKFSPLL